MTETDRKKAANPAYLTTQEVADRLRVTQRTVYNWITNGLLAADKAGPKIWLISEAHLQEFLTHSRPKPRRMVDMQGTPFGDFAAAASEAEPESAAGSSLKPAHLSSKRKKGGRKR